MKCLRYEIAFDGGTRFVLARTDREALGLFKRQWEEFGDTAPEGRIVARWAITF